MNKVEIDLETYNNLYDVSKLYEELKEEYELLMNKTIGDSNEKEKEIRKLTDKINNFLYNALDLKSTIYNNEICNFNIDTDKIAKYITENYLEEAKKMFGNN